MVTLLCLRIIPRTLGMAGLDSSIRTLFQSFIVRDVLIIVELKFGRKKTFFTILYRTSAFDHTSPVFQAFLPHFDHTSPVFQAFLPHFDHTSPVFQAFLTHFENLYSIIKRENPLQYILQVIPSFGGQMATKLLKNLKLN